MDLSDTFRSHAQECQQMASFARDAVEKATWSQMANRWQACAKYYENQLSTRDTGRDPSPKDALIEDLIISIAVAI
jgi:hypothetical protein